MRILAIALVVAVVNAACGQARPTESGPSATGQQAAWDPERIVTLLSDVGIGVYGDPEAGEPRVPLTADVSPLRLLTTQVDGFANELASRGGVLGADLNDLAILTEGSPPFSYFVAGWLARADTPEANRARSVIGVHDWTHPERIVFPNLVLLLFVADVARHTATESATAETPGAGIALARVVQPLSGEFDVAAGTVCSGLQGWVNSVLESFFNALKLEGGGGLVGFIADIWNWAIELAKDVITGLITEIGAAALAAFRVAIGIVGTLSLMASLTQPWTITLTPAPLLDHFAHPGEPDHEGTFTAVVTGNAKWADYVVDCAALAGITLPDPAPAGKLVTWKAVSLAPVSVASVVTTGTDQTIRQDGTAVLAYRASREEANDPAGDAYNGSWLVQARVERLSQADLEKLFGTVVFSGKAGQVLAAVLAPLTQEVTSKLAALAIASGSEVQAIDYHLNDASPPPSAAATAAPSGFSGPACIVGTWWLDTVAYGSLLEALLGSAVVAAVPSGDQLRTYRAGGRLDLTFDDFRVDVLMAQSTPTGGLVTEIAVLLEGDGVLSYTVAGGADGSLAVSYSGSAADIHVTVTEQVKINGDVVPGAPPPFPIVEPSDLIGSTTTYRCDEHRLIEQTPIGPLTWRRED